MKSLAMAQARKELKQAIAASQHEGVVITVHGKPAAMLVGVEGQSMDDLYTRGPELWRLLEARMKRSEPVPWEEAKARLTKKWAADEAAERAGAKRTARQPKRGRKAA